MHTNDLPSSIASSTVVENMVIKRGPMFVSEEFQPADAEDWTACKSNKKKKDHADYGNERYLLKVAIHSWYIRSGATGKVVHFKSSNGQWKRSRARMAAFIGGNIYSNLCNYSFAFSERKPATGFKKRRQVASRRHAVGTIWKTMSGELSSAFDTPSGISGTLALTF